MSKVDIIIPAWNAAAYLPEALDSVLAQTETDWQILLVDDGSTDTTPSVAAAYHERIGDRLRYIRQANAGVSAARNAAFRAGSSPFVAFLDADDTWLPHRLEASLASFIDRPDAALSYGGVDVVDEAGRVLGSFDRSDTGGPGEMARRLYARQVDLPCVTVTARRSALDAVGLFDETLRGSEDRDLWLRVAQRFQVVFIPQVIAVYRKTAGSASRNMSLMLEAQRRMTARHAGEPGCGWFARHEAMGRIYRNQAEASAARGLSAEAVRWALRSALSAPWSREILRSAAWVVKQSLARRSGGR